MAEHTVRSPLPGVFYRHPAPGQPPVTPVPVKSNQKPAKPSLPVHSRPRAHHSKGHRTARHRPKGRR